MLMTDANVPSIRLPGIVYTFYSYKGGVGRSMALVNVGVMLATQGLKVLLVDWDLEAPGLEVYFSKAAVLHGDTTRSLGVLDLLEARVSGRMLSWRDCLLKAEFAGHSLDIITAGSRTADYRRRVQRLNWEALFRDYHVGNFVNDLREEWRNEYDIILVDSRTGVTDTGDICTVLLPDVVVLLFITNYQNIEGIRAVMERAVRVRSKLPINRSKLLGVPVPARDERDREALKFDQWLRIFAKEFSGLYQEWLPAEVDPAEALLRLSIPYIAAWSFGESIPVLESWRNRVDSGSLGAAYTRLATLLAARLDWGALDAKASISDLTSARLEVSALREETKAAEEGRARAEELQIAAELALDRSKMRLRLGDVLLLSWWVSPWRCSAGTIFFLAILPSSHNWWRNCIRLTQTSERLQSNKLGTTGISLQSYGPL
jgi:cellulose biosynthesis protein BcsQ